MININSKAIINPSIFTGEILQIDRQEGLGTCDIDSYSILELYCYTLSLGDIKVKTWFDYIRNKTQRCVLYYQ